MAPALRLMLADRIQSLAHIQAADERRAFAQKRAKIDLLFII